MKLERSKNAKRNIYFGIINKISFIILPFIVRTVFLKKIGSDYLGLNSLFISVLQVLNLSELGFRDAIVYSMYKPIADNDKSAICALLSLYKKVYRIIGSIILVSGVCLLPFIKYLIKGSYPQNINIYFAFFVYLLNSAISYFLFAYKSSLLIAFQRNDVIFNINTVIKATMYILQIIIIVTMKSYYGYILIMPIFTALENVCNACMCKKFYPEYICRGEVNEETKHSVKLKTIGLMVNKLCQTSRNSFDSIFISSFLGLMSTAMYSNYYYIMSAVIAILSIVGNAIKSGIGNSMATESQEKNYFDFRKINFIYMWIAGWCTICLACLYQPFMKMWAGKNLMFSNGIVILFCVYFYSLEMGEIRAVYSDAAGLWWENKYRAIIEAVVNLVLNYIFVQIWGIAGVISATLISLLVINWGIGSKILFQNYFTKISVKDFFIQHIHYLIVTSINLLLTYFVCSRITGNIVTVIILRLVVCMIFSNLFYLGIYYKTKEYQNAIPWIVNLLIDKRK